MGLARDRRRSEDRRSNGYISHLQLFTTIPYEAVESVLKGCEIRDVQAGAVLLEPGQGNDSIHMLLNGRLRIHFDHKDSDDYIPIEQGGCFGELSIIDGQPVSAFVVADQPSRVIAIHESVFWDRLIPQPGVARNLLNVLSERMRVNRDMILERMKDKLALEHLQKELNIAHTIQLSMLPEGAGLFADRSEVRAYAVMSPARDVGGDFYDAFAAAPDRLFVAVGDVSGKSVPAALFMARAMTQLRMEALRGRLPMAILEAVNEALCKGNDAGMFVTLFIGILDSGTGQFSFANAGHNPPLIVASDGTPAFIEVKKGIVAGIMEGARYQTGSLQLEPGQTVLLYTDGVTEAMNVVEEFYLEDRLLDTVSRHAGGAPRPLVDAILASVAEFARNAPQADDITLLALQYLGTPVPADAARNAEPTS